MSIASSIYSEPLEGIPEGILRFRFYVCFLSSPFQLRRKRIENKLRVDDFEKVPPLPQEPFNGGCEGHPFFPYYGLNFMERELGGRRVQGEALLQPSLRERKVIQHECPGIAGFPFFYVHLF